VSRLDRDAPAMDSPANSLPSGADAVSTERRLESSAETDASPLPVDARNATTAAIPDRIVEYVPRAMLTVVPEPTQPVSISYPRDGPAEGHFKALLALFIDEQGVVQRVRSDGAALPPALEAAARDTFLNARWKPGQMGGRVVGSLIQVEVIFESGYVTQTSRPLD
jgi:hypothetical protein